MPGEGNPNFPWEQSHRDNTVLKKKKKERVGGKTSQLRGATACLLNEENGDSASQCCFLSSEHHRLICNAACMKLIVTLSFSFGQMLSTSTAPPPSIHPTVKKHLGKAPAGMEVKQEKSDLPSTQMSDSSLPSSSGVDVSSAKVSDICITLCLLYCYMYIFVLGLS